MADDRDKDFWHKRYHGRAIKGYMGLSLEQRGAYSTFIDLLYDSGWREGIPDRERWFAGILNISVRKWRTIRDELIELGKIEVLPDGSLSDNLYRKERENSLKTSRKRRENGASGGRAKAENSKKLNDINDSDLANGRDLLLYTRARKSRVREEEEEEDIAAASFVTRAQAAAAAETDHWDLVTLTAHLCHVAGVNNVSNPAAHPPVVQRWIEAGADPPMLESLIKTGRDRALKPIRSLNYFDDKVHEAIARRDHPNVDQSQNGSLDDIRDPLLRQYLEGDRSLET